MPDDFPRMPLGAESLGNVSVSDLLSPAARQSRPPRAPDAPQHFEFVDALRGFAILGVIMVHCLLYLHHTHWRVHQFALQGAHGVQLFFVISAFTLFWSLQSRSTSEQNPLRAFYVRRFFRIAPLFYVAAIFYTLLPWGDAHALGQKHGPVQFIATLLFVHGWHPSSINAIVPGGWSIGAEFMFYLCIPLLFRYIRSLSAALWLTLISTTLVSALTPDAVGFLAHHYSRLGSPDTVREFVKEAVYFSFPSQLPVFSLGFVLYFLLRDRISGSAARSVSVPAFFRPGKGNALLLTGIALLMVFGNLPDHILASIAFVALAYGLSLVPFTLAVNRATRFMGTISFSAYIWHFTVLAHIHHLVFKLMGGHLNDSIRFAGLTLAVIAVTIPVATLSYYLIEVPGMNLGKSIIARYGWGKRVRTRETPVRIPSQGLAIGA